MKKFKTSAEKKHLQEATLGQLLADRNLLHTAFISYTHAPLGLVMVSLMLLMSFLVNRPLWSLENALFIYLGIGSVALFYMLQAWEAFARHRQQLRHVRNSFVGWGWLPAGLGLLILYMAMPLGWPVMSLTGILLLMALSYHLPLLGKPLKQWGLLKRLLPALYLSGLLGLPLLSPHGLPGANALAYWLIILVLLSGMALRLPGLLQLNDPAQMV